MTPLLSAPRYDFNWRLDYDLKETLTVNVGTKRLVKWIYDNSVHNHATPDPKINVVWGQQTFQEMMYLRINYRWTEETSTKIRNDLHDKLMATRAFG